MQVFRNNKPWSGRKDQTLQNKVDLYSANLEQYKQKSYNETQVRVDFVNFFFNY